MGVSLHEELRKIAGGDRKATAWLYDTFAPRLYRRLQARYGPLGLDAEELLHDAYVFYLQHDGRVLLALAERCKDETLDEFRVHTALWDLACGVASNKRRSQRRSNLVPLNDSALASDDGTTRQTLTRDLLERLDLCLSHKNPRVYLYFKLRFVDGLAPDDISKTTGWSKKATYKLRQSFNAALSDCADRLEITP
ncbi:MAG: RNA polymerase sigma factor [Gammaproteobacteria bacterium]